MLYLLKSLTPSGYDVARGFVIRAKDEKQARAIAATHAGDETPELWLSEAHSTCTLLQHEGKQVVILRDFNAG